MHFKRILNCICQWLLFAVTWSQRNQRQFDDHIVDSAVAPSATLINWTSMWRLDMETLTHEHAVLTKPTVALQQRCRTARRNVHLCCWTLRCLLLKLLGCVMSFDRRLRVLLWFHQLLCWLLSWAADLSPHSVFVGFVARARESCRSETRIGKVVFVLG